MPSDSMKRDCICAPATPGAVSALCVVRISGEGAKRIASGIFTPRKGGFPMKDRKLYYGDIADNGQWLDEVLLWCFSAPHSYTGEEMVEISCHGSPYIQQQLLALLMARGCRMADPGEFTLRAFLNGKMDLSQAEAVADLIAAGSKAAHQLASSQLKGGYAQELATLRQQCIHFASLLELELDFSEEEVEFADRTQLRQLAETLSGKVERLTGSFRMGNAVKQGIPVAIVGAPNVGKSSLLNALLNDDRAIVSPIPGTTRDTIEETMTLEGILFRFVDTAGLRQSEDPIEAMGTERSLKAMEKAQLILRVRAAGETSSLPSWAERPTPATQKVLDVCNKCDLVPPPYPPGIAVSALTGEGLPALKQQLVQAVRDLLPPTDGILLTNLRHYEALQKVQAALQEVQAGLACGRTPDLLSIDVREAIRHLGEITGEITNNDILNEIFSNFCIGK